MVTTPFGPYQVQVVFTNNTITDVQLITEPGDRHSQRIAASAAPILRHEALQAQNAAIDTVSGATITSRAYAQSLQAALDATGQ
ncbi:MAG: FMN-binding protein [Pseudonocardiales bacterium]|nr:FMN-binding protein [Pseudonocardiales bacterium]